MKIVRKKTDCFSQQVMAEKNKTPNLEKLNTIINNDALECIYGADNKPTTTIFHGF